MTAIAIAERRDRHDRHGTEARGAQRVGREAGLTEREARSPRAESDHGLRGVVGEAEQVERGLGVLHAVRPAGALAQACGRTMQELADELAREAFEALALGRVETAGQPLDLGRAQRLGARAQAADRRRDRALGLPGAELLGRVGADRLGGDASSRRKATVRPISSARSSSVCTEQPASSATPGSTSAGTARSRNTSGAVRPTSAGATMSVRRTACGAAVELTTTSTSCSCCGDVLEVHGRAAEASGQRRRRSGRCDSRPRAGAGRGTSG